MNNIELKPCPFCGGKAHKRIAFPIDADGMEVNMYIVGCEACDIEFYGPWDEEAVIEQWNTRKPMDNIVAELESRKELLNIAKMPNTQKNVGQNAYNIAIDIVEAGGVNEEMYM